MTQFASNIALESFEAIKERVNDMNLFSNNGNEDEPNEENNLTN